MNGPGWPARYEIRVDSVLDDRWADWFGGLQVSSDGTQTMIVGLLPDQPALHGVLTAASFSPSRSGIRPATAPQI